MINRGMKVVKNNKFSKVSNNHKNSNNNRISINNSNSKKIEKTYKVITNLNHLFNKHNNLEGFDY